jgi:hypothetical protein
MWLAEDERAAVARQAFIAERHREIITRPATWRWILSFLEELISMDRLP